MAKEIVKKGRRNVVVDNPGKKEVRGFTIHDREHWFTREQIKKEFGCKTEKEAEKIWKDGKHAKTAKKAESKPEKPATEPLEDKVLAVMRTLAQNGIKECTSTLLRDKLALENKSGRGQIRRVMRKLEKDGKVVISQKTVGKRKQYVYKLK